VGNILFVCIRSSQVRLVKPMHFIHLEPLLTNIIDTEFFKCSHAGYTTNH
jgi:hypothetical protein